MIEPSEFLALISMLLARKLSEHIEFFHEDIYLAVVPLQNRSGRDIGIKSSQLECQLLKIDFLRLQIAYVPCRGHIATKLKARRLCANMRLPLLPIMA